ncbi:hypothetical protein OS175_10780 [Marinicella sp. S1101]|uniref:hypothetical protein n=1 Tax=Marinicella marina TaxID=2996016 RepID=UPI002260E06B|nr:hypothetical protein [Marinicella marina]MCX7554366.1 hypothetical protein [Marinicella marina]MDJ1138643.1 hypothetical protein [Marinicella marina]
MAFSSLADTFAASVEFNPDKTWLEGYIKPAISFKTRNDQLNFYGNYSVVLSATAEQDAYDKGDSGRLTLEEAYLGINYVLNDGVSFDFSVGPREKKLGTGMLIANGGSSGFERGALKFGPRKAWEMAAMGTFNVSDFDITGLYLDANEVPSNDTNTTLNGVDVNYVLGQ